MSERPDESFPTEDWIAAAIEDFRDQKLSAEDLQRLREALTKNADARRQFLRHNLLTFQIANQFLETGGGFGDTDASTEATSQQEISADDSDSADDSHSNIRRVRWQLPSIANHGRKRLLMAGGALLTLSAMLFLGVNLWSLMVGNRMPIASLSEKQIGSPMAENDSVVRPQSTDAPVAVLVDYQSNELPVADETNPDKPEARSAKLDTLIGRPLRAGWLTIDEGQATIRFNQGALVKLTSPARVKLVSESRAFLKTGEIIASVPEEARGFVLDTPNLELIDLGTEFALKTTPTGAAEVHVLNGVVEIGSARQNKSRPRMRIDDTQAVKFERDRPVARMPVDQALKEQVAQLRTGHRIGYYTFDTVEHNDQRITDPTAKVVGGGGVVFSPFVYHGVVPAPLKFHENFNRWSFKHWMPEYRMQREYVGMTVAAENNQTIQLRRLSLEIHQARGTSESMAAPRDGIVRISADGFETFRRFILLDDQPWTPRPVYVTIGLTQIPPAEKYEFRFLFKGPSRARAIRLDEVTVETELLPAAADGNAALDPRFDKATEVEGVLL